MLGLNPLIQLLSTPGSNYFRNMVLAFRMAGTGAAASATPTARSVLGVWNQSLLDAARAVTSFAVSLVSASPDPAIFVNAFGAAVEQAGSLLVAAGVASGGFAVAIGAAVSILGEFMHAMDGMVERYGQYNPEIALAQAQAEVRQMMGDIRRAQEAGPNLVRYIQQRSDMQQKFEDAKIRMMNTLMPVALNLMEILTNLMPAVELAVKEIGSALSFLGDINKILGSIDKNTKKQQDDISGLENFDFLRMIKEGFVLPSEDRGVRTPMGDYR